MRDGMARRSHTVHSCTSHNKLDDGGRWSNGRVYCRSMDPAIPQLRCRDSTTYQHRKAYLVQITVVGLRLTLTTKASSLFVSAGLCRNEIFPAWIYSSVAFVTSSMSYGDLPKRAEGGPGCYSRGHGSAERWTLWAWPSSAPRLHHNTALIIHGYSQKHIHVHLVAEKQPFSIVFISASAPTFTLGKQRVNPRIARTASRLLYVLLSLRCTMHYLDTKKKYRRHQGGGRGIWLGPRTGQHPSSHRKRNPTLRADSLETLETIEVRTPSWGQDIAQRLLALPISARLRRPIMPGTRTTMARRDRRRYAR